MSRILVFSLLVFITSASFSQDLKSVQRSIAGNDWKAARTQVDQYLGEPAHQKEAGAWYYKGKIYTELSKISSGNEKLQLQQEALASFRQYQTLDTLNTMMELDRNVDLFRIYDASYNQGIALYNKKQFEEAYRYFKTALDAKDYIFSKGFSLNGFSFTALDTQLVNLAGMAAWQAGKEREAIEYFQKIVDSKIRDKELKSLYALVALEYISRSSGWPYRPTEVDPYTIGKSLFPDDSYWQIVLTAGLDPAVQSHAYDSLIISKPESNQVLLQYFRMLMDRGERESLSSQELKTSENLLQKLFTKEQAGKLDRYEKMQLHTLMNRFVEQVKKTDPAKAESWRQKTKGF